MSMAVLSCLKMICMFRRTFIILHQRHFLIQFRIRVWEAFLFIITGLMYSHVCLLKQLMMAMITGISSLHPAGDRHGQLRSGMDFVNGRKLMTGKTFMMQACRQMLPNGVTVHGLSMQYVTLLILTGIFYTQEFQRPRILQMQVSTLRHPLRICRSR